MKGELDDSEFTYAWGFDELREYVALQEHRFYSAEFESFNRATYALIRDDLQYDEGFILKKRLRDLQIDHRSSIRAHARLLKEVQARFDLAHGDHYTRVTRELEHSGAAIRGISGALERLGADEPKRSALDEKLRGAQERQRVSKSSLERIYESEE